MDKYAQLEKLDELKTKGIITSDEFVIERNRVLNGNDEVRQTVRVTPSPTSKKTNGAATTGLVLGLVGILILPLLLGIIGLIFSVIGLSRDVNEYGGRGKATAGLILSIVNLIWGFFWFALFIK